MKHYFSELIFESPSGYFVDCIIHLLNLINIFFDNIDQSLGVYSIHKKVLISGDIQVQEGEKCLDKYLYQPELKSANKEATCYRNQVSQVALISY